MRKQRTVILCLEKFSGKIQGENPQTGKIRWLEFWGSLDGWRFLGRVAERRTV